MLTLRQELNALLDAEEYFLASLLIGRIDEPSLRIDPFIEEVDAIVHKMTRRCGKLIKDPIFVVEKLNKLIFEESAYRGKTPQYHKLIDNADQYYFHKFFTEQKGSPLMFCMLYVFVLKRLGIEVEAICFPSQYLIKVSDAVRPFYVDPFDAGKLLSENEFQRKFRSSMQKNRLLSTHLFESLSEMQLLAKQLQQLKHVYVLKNDSLRALRAVELLLVLVPDSAELMRDRGVLYCEMEYFSKAMEDLKYYLKTCPNADDVGDIKKLTTMLRGFRETMN